VARLVRDARTVTFQGPLRELKTGTGFACAKLSEILPAARVARFVRMTYSLAMLASFLMTEALAFLALVRMSQNPD
jgi:hypothetical protein